MYFGKKTHGKTLFLSFGEERLFDDQSRLQVRRRLGSRTARTVSIPRLRYCVMNIQRARKKFPRRNYINHGRERIFLTLKIRRPRLRNMKKKEKRGRQTAARR